MTPPSLLTAIPPHGGVLIDRLCIEGAEAEALRERARRAPRLTLSDVALSDLELIATGVFSPLTGFLTQAEYTAVVRDMHLPNGLPWTLPVTLAVPSEQAEGLRVGQDVALIDGAGRLVGLLELTEMYPYDRETESQQVYGTTDPAHPGVARLLAQGDIYLAGPVWMLAAPSPQFPDLYLTPAQSRAIFAERGWRRIVAFQTRNPIHRAHEYLQKCALEMADGLLLHPLVGETKADDIPAAVRVESYRVVLEHYFPRERVLLASFPAAMRYAGPREAIFHAICRKNYGCTHFIVGRDHAGVGSYYGTYDAQRIFDQFDPALIGITPLMFEHAFHCFACGQIVTAKTCPHDASQRLHLSGTEVRSRLAAGELLPLEFTRPEVSRVLMQAYQQGQPS
ncbi:MAG: sulfate adenylyltransferase [Anaerolineae bacterium]|nr:sulfate adenylyltransferase [Anaerolineae bacterium]